MRREYRHDPDYVIDRRLSTAASVSGRPVDGNGSARAMALLSLSKDEDAADPQRARRAVARYSMLRAHQCSGKACVLAAHKADREWRDELIEMLDLAGEQG